MKENDKIEDLDALERYESAMIDADIEGLTRDPEVEAMVDKWRADGIDGRPGGGNRMGVPQLERPVDEIHVVASEVTQRAHAVVPEAPPLERVDVLAVGSLRGGAKPQIPVDVVGRFGRLKDAAMVPQGLAAQADTSRQV